jgi:hypothetical protein
MVKSDQKLATGCVTVVASPNWTSGALQEIQRGLDYGRRDNFHSTTSTYVTLRSNFPTYQVASCSRRRSSRNQSNNRGDLRWREPIRRAVLREFAPLCDACDGSTHYDRISHTADALIKGESVTRVTEEKVQ